MGRNKTNRTIGIFALIGMFALLALATFTTVYFTPVIEVTFAGTMALYALYTAFIIAGAILLWLSYYAVLSFIPRRKSGHINFMPIKSQK
jgi:hypothetical protein